MRILGIESSCDDTSVALLECSRQGCFVIRESTASQIDVHKKYGGVVPEIAGRMHAEKILPLIEAVLTPPLLNKESPPAGEAGAGVRFEKPDAIAVASGPGLITGLIVGVEAARVLSYAWKIPLISVNHIEGHIHSVEVIKTLKHKNIKTKKIKYPALALIVSGGHTELIQIKKPGQYKLIGATRDDAAGECFDKIAKLIGLPYPGGPQISKLAEKGNTKAINFPRPMLNQNNFNFSFAGLKTAALYYFQKHPKANKADFCASFEQAIVDTLVGKTIRAARQLKPKTIILAGGVAANKKLRQILAEEIKVNLPNSRFQIPDSKYCMDNATMIAVAGFASLEPQAKAGYYKTQKMDYADLSRRSSIGAKADWRALSADPNWELGRPS